MTLLIGLIIAGIVMLLVEIFCSDGRIYLALQKKKAKAPVRTELKLYDPHYTRLMEEAHRKGGAITRCGKDDCATCHTKELCIDDDCMICNPNTTIKPVRNSDVVHIKFHDSIIFNMDSKILPSGIWAIPVVYANTEITNGMIIPSEFKIVKITVSQNDIDEGLTPIDYMKELKTEMGSRTVFNPSAFYTWRDRRNKALAFKHHYQSQSYNRGW